MAMGSYVNADQLNCNTGSSAVFYPLPLAKHASSTYFDVLLRQVHTTSAAPLDLCLDDQIALLRDRILRRILLAHQVRKKVYSLLFRSHQYEILEAVHRLLFGESNVTKHYKSKLRWMFGKVQIIASVEATLTDTKDKYIGVFHAYDIRF